MKIKSDHIGIILSCTCVIHCLALPFILLAMGFYSNNELIHGLFLLLAMAVTSHAVYHSYKKHCKHIVIFFGLVGIGFLGIDLFAEHGVHDHGPEIDVFAIIGSMFLIATHLLNLYYNRVTSKACGDCHD